MLASQVIGNAGPGTVLGTMFPAAAFGSKLSITQPTASQLAQSPSQNIGSPLPPGTVSYDNTWNNSQSLVCKTQSVPSAPLSTVTANSWTSTISIPEELFMNNPTGQYINQTVSVFSNGTFAVSDDEGNSFGWSAISGLPVSSQAPSFTANGSMAVLNYQKESVLSQTRDNVSVYFSVNHQFCQPSGLEITVQGKRKLGG